MTFSTDDYFDTLRLSIEFRQPFGMDRTSIRDLADRFRADYELSDDSSNNTALYSFLNVRSDESPYQDPPTYAEKYGLQLPFLQSTDFTPRLYQHFDDRYGSQRNLDEELGMLLEIGVGSTLSTQLAKVAELMDLNQMAIKFIDDETDTAFWSGQLTLVDDSVINLSDSSDGPDGSTPTSEEEHKD